MTSMMRSQPATRRPIDAHNGGQAYVGDPWGSTYVIAPGNIHATDRFQLGSFRSPVLVLKNSEAELATEQFRVVPAGWKWPTEEEFIARLGHLFESDRRFAISHPAH